jgi:hypothetical protein
MNPIIVPQFGLSIWKKIIHIYLRVRLPPPKHDFPWKILTAGCAIIGIYEYRKKN